MAINYTTFVSELANLMVVSSANTEFNTQLPGIIDYAEGRLYRELDLVYTQVTNSTGATVAAERNFTVPSTFVVIDEVNLLTPAGAASSVATRVPLTPVSKAYVDNLYPTSTATGEPQFFAMYGSDDGSMTNLVLVLGPSPDDAYFVEVTGEQRPATLSSANSSTILTQYCPDLFMAAAMVYASGYLKNFGSQADNPQQAQAWEQQYQLLFQSAQTEQQRLNFASQGWTSKPPATLATPPRA